MFDLCFERMIYFKISYKKPTISNDFSLTDILMSSDVLTEENILGRKITNKPCKVHIGAIFVVMLFKTR